MSTPGNTDWDAPAESNKSTNMDGDGLTGRSNLRIQVLPEELSPERKQAHVELVSMFYRLPTDPTGVLHVGTDGILRSLTADRKVVAAVPLEPRHIKAHLDQAEWDGELEACYRGVDGTKVSHEQWFEPAPGVLPPRLEGDDLKEAKRMVEESAVGRDDLSTGKDDTESPVQAREACPIVVLSDHDVVIKT